MIFNRIGQSGGFITTIILIVAGLIILGSFGYNFQDIVNSPMVQKNLNYAWSLVKYVWQNYIQVPAIFVWEKIIIGLGWNNLIKLFPNKTSSYNNEPPLTSNNSTMPQFLGYQKG